MRRRKNLRLARRRRLTAGLVEVTDILGVLKELMNNMPKIYLSSEGGYSLVPDSEVMTVSLPEGHEDKHEAVLDAVEETLGSRVVIINEVIEDE